MHTKKNCLKALLPESTCLQDRSRFSAQQEVFWDASRPHCFTVLLSQTSNSSAICCIVGEWSSRIYGPLSTGCDTTLFRLKLSVTDSRISDAFSELTAFKSWIISVASCVRICRAQSALASSAVEDCRCTNFSLNRH